MTHKANLIGAVLASLAFLIVIFAGRLGQLFTMSGAVKTVPSYSTNVAPQMPQEGYADPLTYDEQGALMDYSKNFSRIIDGDVTESDICPDRQYVYEFSDKKIWIKGTKLAAVEEMLHSLIDPHLEACAPESEEEFSCAPGCSVSGEDSIMEEKPLSLTLLSANVASPSALQYIFQVNASCTRVRQCAPTQE